MNLGREAMDTICSLISYGRIETLDISYAKVLPLSME